jgi:hypothetical protein
MKRTYAYVEVRVYVVRVSSLSLQGGYRCLAVESGLAVAVQLVYLYVVGMLVSARASCMVAHST